MSWTTSSSWRRSAFFRSSRERASSSRVLSGATRMMSPTSSFPSPLLARMMSSAWSQGTLRSRMVIFPRHVVGDDDVLLADLGDDPQQVVDVDVLELEGHLLPHVAGAAGGGLRRGRRGLGGERARPGWRPRPPRSSAPWPPGARSAPRAVRSTRSSRTPSAETTTRIFWPSPGTAKVLIIFTGVPSAEVSRLRSSRLGSFTPLRVSTAPRSSGRSTWKVTGRVSDSSTRPPRADSTKPRLVSSPAAGEATGAGEAADTRLPSISTSPSWRSRRRRPPEPGALALAAPDRPLQAVPGEAATRLSGWPSTSITSRTLSGCDPTRRRGEGGAGRLLHRRGQLHPAHVERQAAGVAQLEAARSRSTSPSKESDSPEGRGFTAGEAMGRGAHRPRFRGHGHHLARAPSAGGQAVGRWAGNGRDGSGRGHRRRVAAAVEPAQARLGGGAGAAEATAGAAPAAGDHRDLQIVPLGLHVVAASWTGASPSPGPRWPRSRRTGRW